MPDQTKKTTPVISPLEPRVASLEVGLDRLTEDVRTLANVVRNQGSAMEQEIQKLVVAVTQAAGPRKTDWSVIISAVLLIMAIGSAVFWPLNQKTDSMYNTLQSTQTKLEKHEKLDMHPVGQALVQHLEGELKTYTSINEKQMEEHNKLIDVKIAGIQGKNDLYIEKLFWHVTKLEDQNQKLYDKEHDELMQWRQKAMGLGQSNK